MKRTKNVDTYLENGFTENVPSTEPPILKNTEKITPPKISAVTVCLIGRGELGMIRTI